MENIFLQVLEISIMASYLIVAVLLIRGCFKKASASFKCILWLLVGVRLLIPITISTPFGLVPQVEIAGEQEAENYGQANVQDNRGDLQYSGDMSGTSEAWKPENNVYPSGTTGVGMTDTTVAGNVAVSGVVMNPSQAGTHDASADKALSDERSIAEGLQNMVAYLWLSGMILMLCYMLFSWLRLHRSLRTAIPEMAEMTKRQIKVYRAENIQSPFLLGTVSPKIYLPYGIEGKDVEYVLAHELMHIHRKDHLLKPLSFMVLALHWFNPLVWVAYILLGKDIEQACDEQVLRENDGLDRAGYARALLSCGGKQQRFDVCPVAFGESDVKVRVKKVLHYKKPGFWIVLIGAVICVVVVLCFMTVSEEESGEDTVTVSGEANSGTDEIGDDVSEGATTEELSASMAPSEEPVVTNEPAQTTTAAPTSEPIAEPATDPTATPDPAATPVPTVVPEDYVPGPIAGFTESQSKQIREELRERLKYKMDVNFNNHDMLVWLDNEEYVPGESLGSMWVYRPDGMQFVSLDTVNYVEGLEMDGQKWVAVTLMPHVEKDDVVFPYAEKAIEIMIPVSIQGDGSVELGTYYPKRFATDGSDGGYSKDYYEENNYIRTRIHLMQADVTHDGIDDNIEIFMYFPPEMDMSRDIDTLVAQYIGVYGVLIQVYDGSTATADSFGTPILYREYSTAHAGNGALNVVHSDGKDYLVETSTWSGQGSYDYSFYILALDEAGHQYIIDYEYMNWDERTDERETLKPAISAFRDRLTPWIEDGEIVVAADLDLYMITTERWQYEAHDFYDHIFLRY